MSAQDLCALPFLDAVLAAAPTALKIEGRNRKPDYVYTVVQAYREAIDAWHQGLLTEELKAKLTERVTSVYNRGFSSGFFFGRPVADFSAANGNTASLRKEYVGRVTNYYRKARVAEIDIQDCALRKGDLLSIQGNTTGAMEETVHEVWQDESPVEAVFKGTATVPIGQRVRAGDRVYRKVPR